MERAASANLVQAGEQFTIRFDVQLANRRSRSVSKSLSSVASSVAVASLPQSPTSRAIELKKRDSDDYEKRVNLLREVQTFMQHLQQKYKVTPAQTDSTIPLGSQQLGQTLQPASLAAIASSASMLGYGVPEGNRTRLNSESSAVFGIPTRSNTTTGSNLDLASLNKKFGQSSQTSLGSNSMFSYEPQRTSSILNINQYSAATAPTSSISTSDNSISTTSFSSSNSFVSSNTSNASASSSNGSVLGSCSDSSLLSSPAPLSELGKYSVPGFRLHSPLGTPVGSAQLNTSVEHRWNEFTNISPVHISSSTTDDGLPHIRRVYDPAKPASSSSSIGSRTTSELDLNSARQFSQMIKPDAKSPTKSSCSSSMQSTQSTSAVFPTAKCSVPSSPANLPASATHSSSSTSVSSVRSADLFPRASISIPENLDPTARDLLLSGQANLKSSDSGLSEDKTQSSGSSWMSTMSTNTSTDTGSSLMKTVSDAAPSTAHSVSAKTGIEGAPNRAFNMFGSGKKSEGEEPSKDSRSSSKDSSADMDKTSSSKENTK